MAEEREPVALSELALAVYVSPRSADGAQAAVWRAPVLLGVRKGGGLDLAPRPHQQPASCSCLRCCCCLLSQGLLQYW